MKAEALPRCTRIQDLFRAFAAGTGAAVPESLRYLALPFWHPRVDGKTWTVAGDGRVFLWARVRVPGFADYVSPPGGFGYFDLPQVWGLWRAGREMYAPQPLGAHGSGQSDTIYFTQSPAVVRRYDLARLQLLDSCSMGPGEAHRDAQGRPLGWRTVSFTGNFNGVALCGVVFCDDPPAVKLAKIRAKAALKRAKNAAK